MNKAILFVMLLMVAPSALAVENLAITEPYSKTINPQGELGKSWQTILSELTIKSCYDKANYESGICDYAYYCYAILPATSSSINDALQKECKEATSLSDVTLNIVKFVPPKGLPVYVTSFVTKVRYTYSSATTSWVESVSIPNQYIHAGQVRTVCTPDAMLKLTPNGYQCYKAQRICLDTTDSGLCTNQYTLFALDLNSDGIVSSTELIDGTNYCVDRPTATAVGDGICDTVQDLGCADVCSKYSSTGQCIVTGGNGLCDIWDIVATKACVDDVLSKNSKICDRLETGAGICPSYWQPVCYNAVGGIGGTTYPNSCFADSLGKVPYTNNSCKPPITQCYVVQDCPDLNVCVGGTTAISKACVSNQCSYSGTCGDLSCTSNVNCDVLEANLCAGVDATCQNSKCVIQGKCITQPIPTSKSIWDLILSVWNAFWVFVRSLFA